MQAHSLDASISAFRASISTRSRPLYYNWHRYYDPSTGRYTQSDPQIDPFGLYEFSFNFGVGGTMVIGAPFMRTPYGGEGSVALSFSRSGLQLSLTLNGVTDAGGAFAGFGVQAGGGYGKEICSSPWIAEETRFMAAAVGKKFSVSGGMTQSSAGVNVGVFRAGPGIGAYAGEGRGVIIQKGWSWPTFDWPWN